MGTITTIYDQVHESIIKESIIVKSIRKLDSYDYSNYFNRETIDNAYNWVQERGFIRIIVMPRLLDVQFKASWYERKLFVKANYSCQ